MKLKFAALSLALVVDAQTQGQAAYEPPFASTTLAMNGVAPQFKPDFGGPAVMLAPVAGMTVQIPKGWIACDRTSNALLGNAPDKLSLTAKVCAGPRSGGPIVFGAFDPRPLHTVSIHAGKEREQQITEAQIAHLSDMQLKAMTTGQCPLIEQPIRNSGAAIDSCTLKKEIIGGHVALVSRIVYTPPMGSIAQGVAEEWVLATDIGVFDFDLTWPVVVQDTVKPVLDAIRASLTVK